jgi:site-specific DNA-methyltransferase (adenine-specific)
VGEALPRLVRDLSSFRFSPDENCLVQADALELASCLPGGCLDLIYLDPPFGTGKSQRVLKGRGGRFGSGREIAYQDPAMPENAPVPGLPSWLPPLLGETRRLLRPGGALFLHLDGRGASQARLLLDELFGAGHFLNEIVWHYATGGIPTRWLARKHDTILYYRNGPGHTFHRLKEKKYLAHRMGRRGVEEFQDAGGWYRFRSLDDVWEIPWLTQDAKERTGYPTQKPQALLERILSLATDEGDRVADFCAGSGTTAAAAQKLGRRWIIGDVSPLALRTARRRLLGEE